ISHTVLAKPRRVSEGRIDTAMTRRCWHRTTELAVIATSPFADAPCRKVAGIQPFEIAGQPAQGLLILPARVLRHEAAAVREEDQFLAAIRTRRLRSVIAAGSLHPQVTGVQPGAADL